MVSLLARALAGFLVLGCVQAQRGPEASADSQWEQQQTGERPSGEPHPGADVDMEEMVCGDDRTGGPCKPCKYRPPKGFPFAPCPVDTFLQGTVKLGGDVKFGRMSLSIDANIRNACKKNQKHCQRARLSIKNFHIDKIMYVKDKNLVVQHSPPTSPGCSVCDVILTYPEDNVTPVPPPPGCTCDVKTDYIAAVDTSKSMSQPSTTPKATKKLLSEVTRRFKIGEKHTRFALSVFGDDSRFKWDLRSHIATSYKLIRGGIATIKFGNSFSNHASAVDGAATLFKEQARHRVPRLFTLFADGKPNKDVRRLELAIKRLMCQPHVCFTIVGINARRHSEEEAYFKYLLGCGDSSPCPSLILFDTLDSKAPSEVADKLTRRQCECAKNKPAVPYADAVTTFTVRIPDKTLADFGSRDELNRAVDEMLYDAAEATGVNPGRLTAIAIEDTLGNAISDDVTAGKLAGSASDMSTNPATLVEVMFEEPGLNVEPKSQESVRALASILQDREHEIADQLAAQGIANATIERMAIRQYDGNMPIIDVLQV